MSTHLITGATGFVGKQLVNRLLSEGHHVISVSRGPRSGKDTIICDFALSDFSNINFSNIDVVFHLAGFAHDLGDASKVEGLYRAVNVDAPIQLAKLALHNKVKCFVFVSSVKAGGSTITGQCMTEEDQCEPEGIYGNTKREAELKLLEIGRQSDMLVSIIRPCLVYGPNVKGNLRMMLSGIEMGWFPPLPEVGNRRSMIHVDDLVRAILLVANNERTNGEIYIATDGQQYSSHQIYEVMCSVLGKPIPQWSVPKFLFDLLGFMNAGLRYKVNKLLGDECYSSEKLQSIGFKAQRSLKEMDETSF